MLSILRKLLRGVAMLFGATVLDGVGLFGWLARSSWEGLTGRSLAAEQAARLQDQTRVDEADQARAEEQARHEETALLAEQQLAATHALGHELARVARAREDGRSRVRAHDPVVQTSCEPDDEPEPEGGAPLPAYAV